VGLELQRGSPLSRQVSHLSQAKKGKDEENCTEFNWPETFNKEAKYLVAKPRHVWT